MTAAYPTDTQVPPRSSFVTVVAWIFIVLSGFATLVGALQNLMIRSMPFDQVDSVLQDSTTATQFPPAARFMFSHFRLLFLATFLLSLVMLVASWGLLRRRDWARVIFSAMLVLGILYMIGGLFIQQSLISSFDTSFRGAAPQDSVFRANADQFRGMFTAMRVVETVFSLGIAGLFGWIVVKLSSPRIRAEFSARAA